MKRLLLFLFLTALFQPSHTMIKSASAIMQQTFDSSNFWKSVACLGVGLWIVDKSIPLLKSSWNYWYQTPKAPDSKKPNMILIELMSSCESRLTASIKKSMKELEENKITPLQRRLQKFEDLMVDYQDAKATLKSYENKMKRLLSEVNSLPVDGADQSILDDDGGTPSASDNEEETFYSEDGNKIPYSYHG
jgi:hypothetical protein